MMTLFFALVFELLTELTADVLNTIFSFGSFRSRIDIAQHLPVCSRQYSRPHRALLINDGMQNLKQLFAYRSNI